MNFPDFNQRRLQDLENNITKDMDLLEKFRDAMRNEDDIRKQGKYELEIKRQQESIVKYQQEYEELKELVTNPKSSQMQKVESQIQQMDTKINSLLENQETIYQEIGKTRQTLLSHYDSSQQAIVEEIATKLDQNQLDVTEKLLNAVEANQVSEQQIQQMLNLLEQRILASSDSQTQSIAKIIKDPQLDIKNKLKVAIPIIPLLVEYQGFIELGSGFNLKSVWQQLMAKLGRT